MRRTNHLGSYTDRVVLKHVKVMRLHGSALFWLCGDLTACEWPVDVGGMVTRGVHM
eukprot:m.784392 g.784392  ORF g.784392 m.784392 type:complete len:56 (-) comp23298_c3_seq5:2079-2246(-)